MTVWHKVLKTQWGKLLFAFILFTLNGCEVVQTTQAGAVGVTRQQTMSVSRERVERDSAIAYTKLIQEAQKKGVLNTNQEMLARVRRITQRLTPHIAVYRSDASKWKWEVNVIQSDEANAFCMAGGKMVVYSGIIDKLKLNDDELAAIMGHEMAHALREHVREQISQQQMLGLVTMGAVIGGAIMGVNINPDIAQDSLQVLVGLPHSREAEREADQIGLELSARGGYNPLGAVTLWKKMAQYGGSSPPVFLSTHPSPASRSDDLVRVGKIVDPLYQAANKNQPSR